MPIRGVTQRIHRFRREVFGRALVTVEPGAEGGFGEDQRDGVLEGRVACKFFGTIQKLTFQGAVTANAGHVSQG